jgi:alanine dehydrogenase
MEISAIHGWAFEQNVLTLEKSLKIKKSETILKIGIPKEISHEERRVVVTPEGASILIGHGHEVYVEAGAGDGAHFADTQYADVGATISQSAAELYGNVEVVAKMFPPTAEELDLLQERQILISALHLGTTTPDTIRRLMDLRITGIGFEFISDAEESFPIVQMMHEISGSMSVQIAARYLESNMGGRGLMLGGISGIPPATVVILGAGVVGEWAARTALGFGANVIVLDTDLSPLRTVEHHLSRRVTTAIANPQYLRRVVRSADVLIGAMMTSGQKAPIVVHEDLVAEMRAGSVIVDVVMDQGGCIETSRPTTLSHPTFVKHGVVHYCVPNIPANVARTSSIALSNVLVPFLVDIGEHGGINNALWNNHSLRSGTYTYRNHLTKQILATMFQIPYRDIELLIASGI